MSVISLTYVFFLYGLAFFCMGLIVLLEGGRASDPRLRRALRPLVGFGLVHAVHEWLEMFLGLGLLPGYRNVPMLWESLKLALLVFSFLSLTAFGASLLAPSVHIRRISLVIPLLQAAIWGFGLLVMRGQYIPEGALWDVADVWTRYVVGIPGAIAACIGLLHQQRVFRLVGMVRFGRDSLWAAVAFAWYGLVGQFFTRYSPLPPSNVINQDLFLQLFGFPVQLLRAAAAVVASVFVMRFMRSFEVETRRQIGELQAERLQEAKRREALKGELLRQVVAAQEAERQRIARELHDETGQALTAIGMGLRGAATVLRQDEDKAAHNLRQLEGLTARSLDELRRLIADLRPSHLDDLGLGAALRWYAGEMQERTSIRVDVYAPDGPCTMDSTVRTALFRVAQEALTNIVKHAQASRVWVRVSLVDKNLRLEVKDNGVGFDQGQLAAANKSSWGLLGMQERAELLGGQFILDSTPGKGTRVVVNVPCDVKHEDQDEDSIVVSG